jgi:hypothetical protein
MIFSNQISLTFPKFLKLLNHYDCSRIRLLSQGPKRTSQDRTLTYRTFLNTNVSYKKLNQWGILIQGGRK